MVLPRTHVRHRRHERRKRGRGREVVRVSKLEVGDAWDGTSMPPVGATIIWKGDGSTWYITTGWGSWSANASSQFVSSRQFDLSGGLFPNTAATWDGSCFRVDDGAGGSSCLEASTSAVPGHWEHHASGWVWTGGGKPTSLPPTHSQAPPAPPANAGPGKWEKRTGGWVWVATAPHSISPPPSPPATATGPGRWARRPNGWVWVQDAHGVSMPGTQSKKQDLANGYTHYLCSIDEYGKNAGCGTMTQAQTELAIQTAFATPIGAEDRVAGRIEPIDPFGNYGPPTLNPPGTSLMPRSALTVHLLQWQAIQAAILANPQAGVPGGASPGTDQAASSSSTSTSQDASTSSTTPVEKHVNFGVRVLEGLAAIAGIFVAVKIWKAATK